MTPQDRAALQSGPGRRSRKEVAFGQLLRRPIPCVPDARTNAWLSRQYHFRGLRLPLLFVNRSPLTSPHRYLQERTALIMQTFAVQSTTLAAIAYDHSTNLLQLEFRTHSVYQYFGVPPATYEQLMLAPSKGQYFNQHIRGRFPYARPSQLTSFATPT